MDCEKRILEILNAKDCAVSLGLFKTRNRMAVLSAGIEPAFFLPQRNVLSIERRKHIEHVLSTCDCTVFMTY